MPAKLVGRILLVLCCAIAAAPALAQAKTYEVTRRGDPSPGKCRPNDCSLREAVRAANKRAGKDRILLPSRKRYVLRQKNPGGNGDDNARNGDLDVLDRLRILHRGKGRATVDARRVGRHFDALASLGIRKLRLIRGNPNEDASNDFNDGGAIDGVDGVAVKVVRSVLARNRAMRGGAIQTTDADKLTVKSSRIARNSAAFGGGILVWDGQERTEVIRSRVLHNEGTSFDGGGIEVANGAGLLVARSTVAYNRAPRGGGIYEQGAGTGPIVVRRSRIHHNRALVARGGGILARGALRVVRSTIDHNRAEALAGGANAEGGGIYGGDPTRVVGSTLHHNRADNYGGAIFGDDLRTVNSTFARNRAGFRGGGIYISGGGVADLDAVTVVRNRAGIAGGGLYNDQADVIMFNTLLARNRVAAAPNDCAVATPASFQHGFNLVSTTGPSNACPLGGDPDSVYPANAGIGKLRDNGGPTPTIALRKGSPAINAADPGGPHGAPKRDQRGRKRKNPDIGAYERR